MKRTIVISSLFSFLLLFSSCREAAIKLEKPAVPGKPYLKPSVGKLEVTWDTVPGATEYRIYYNTKPEFPEKSPDKETNKLSATIDGLTNGTTYYVWVRAANKGGASSASEMAEGKIPFLGTPGKPSLTQGAGRITVAWSAVDSAESYAIYYSETETPPLEPHTNTMGTSAVINELDNGTTYYVWVKALHKGGDSSLSERAQTTLVSSAPGKPSLTPGLGSITVTWDTVPGAIEYRVYYSETEIQPSEYISTKETSVTINDRLADGITYYVWVEASNDGGISLASEPVQTTLPSLGSPNKPSLTQGMGSITVAWNVVDSAESYAVYYSTSETPPSAPHITTLETSTTINGLANGATYYVWVKALHKSGDSLLSEWAQTTFAPSTPDKPSLTPSLDSIAVTWDPVHGATEYRVYYNVSGTPSSAPYITTAGTSVTIDELANGITYYVWVKAVNEGGDSSLSEPVQTTLPNLGAPGKPSLTPSLDSIAVTWNAVPGATEYHVYYNVSGTPSSAPYITTAGTSVTINGLAKGTTYYMWVKALHKSGDSPLSERVQTTLAPSAPGKPSLTSSLDSIAVAWTPVFGATEYLIYYSASGTPPSTPYVTTAGTSATINGLANGTTYYVWVKAVNEGGASPLGERTQTMLPHLDAPSKPSLTQGVGSITVVWSAVDSAESYAIYYSVSETPPSAPHTNTTETSAVINELDNGTTYYVWVKALHKSGDSLLSEWAQITFAPSTPGKPILTPHLGGLAVTWDPVHGATAYRVYYSASGTPPSTHALTVTESNAVIPGLTYENTYYVWVQAENIGGVSVLSEPSTGTPLVSTISIILDKGEFGGNNEPSIGNTPLDNIHRIEKKDYMLTITDNAWDSYEWRLDGVIVSSAAVYTFNSFSPEMTVGYHTLTIITMKNNRAYSTSLRFLVSN